MSLASFVKSAEIDLQDAYGLLYPPKDDSGKYVDIPLPALNKAAYEATQAIEKCLKGVIEEEMSGMLSNAERDELNTLLHTHSIERLVIKAELLSQGFMNNHRFVAENAYTLGTCMNLMRYPENYCIGKKPTYILFKEARDFCRDIKQKYFSKEGAKEDIDKKITKDTEKEYQGLQQVRLNTNVSKYNYSSR